MSAARPAARSLLSRRCLGGAPNAAVPSSVLAATQVQQPPTCRRQFHASAPVEVRRRPRFSNVHAKAMGLVTEEDVSKVTNETFPELTKEELAAMEKIYTPEQLEALKAGEKAVDPRDLTVQGRVRIDPYRLGYLSDLSKIDPVVDKRVKKEAPPNTRARFMTGPEFVLDFYSWMKSFLPKNINLEKDLKNMSEDELNELLDKYTPSHTDLFNFMVNRSSMTDGGQLSNTAVAPALMSKVPGVAGLYKRQVDPADEGLDDEGKYQHAKKQTGLSVQDILGLRHKILVQRFVTNQTRLGKVQSWHIMTIVGNGNGRIGLGEAKSVDGQIAMHKARLMAIKNMVPIRRYEDRTIYGKVKVKIAGTVVEMAARPPGFGLRISHRLFEICRLAGIKDLSASIPRSRNPMNTVKAAMKALQSQPDPEAIAIGRGKKLVDVRKVYYGGHVI
ncbi:hypothetical protein MCOR27_009958 [Pyricularia oryzae]|uniref:S5 DRBM domain-containing protein n=5 Tax=Pyricularia TaxID=48558 RepID=A0ABQ8NDA4_PYRGI|nr:37S ribosomal protein S5 [Pyricularia oryzae 70-15]ELQ36403.1 37S ribosomal protein S5 [Pyricularia oryzae Y34]KAH8842109.1 hypothetical protein MCOR01_006045 [Pyricularia oryzae]KAI6293944.1 hypothetical protein MCOR33_008806 [Pyricularia grisea]EHA57138.1 37S ribosomal protein S5 [Pyricularia oryzae 70-15]KAH9435297.1 hypothetical protein MCOR02_004246 [Pyricularia oryzae]